MVAYIDKTDMTFIATLSDGAWTLLESTYLLVGPREHLLHTHIYQSENGSKRFGSQNKFLLKLLRGQWHQESKFRDLVIRLIVNQKVRCIDASSD